MPSITSTTQQPFQVRSGRFSTTRHSHGPLRAIIRALSLVRKDYYGWRFCFTASLGRSLAAIIHLRISPQIVMLNPLCVLLLASGCSRNSRTSIRLESDNAPRAGETASVAKVQTLPLCSMAGAKPVPNVFGHHKVTLSWDAPVPSTWLQKGVIGYCIYRSQTTFTSKTSNTSKKAANKDFKCSNCELINPIPFDGVACVDDLVKDGASYFYVVTAINIHRNVSLPSNETSAAIPNSTEAVGPPTQGSYPLCRGSVATKGNALLRDR